MAEFGAEVSNFPTLSSSVSPQAGVVKSTPFFEGVASVFDQAGEMLTKKKEAKSVGVLAEFTNKQLAIADAVDQGVYNSRHAQTLLRKNLMEAIAANPLIAKDLVASQSSIVGLAGGADIVKEGNDQERRQRLRYDAMVSSGFMPADTSDEEAKRYDLALQESEEASRRHKLRMETIDEKLKLNTLSSSERTRLNEERQGEANRYVRDSSEATSMYLSTKFSSILTSDMSEGEKEMAIEDEYNKWFSETSTILGQASSQEAEYMLKPIQGLKDTYLKRARGEISDAEVKRGTDRALALQKALVLADPAVARTVAATELLGADAFVKALGMSDGVIKSAFNITEGLSDTSSNAPNFFSEEADFNKASEAVLGSVLENLNSKDEKASTEAKGFLGKIFESIEDNAGTISRDPKKTKGVVDWLSSSAFLKASQENPELFQDIEGAKDVLERNYADEVWGLVEREFKTSEVVIQKTPSGSEMAALMASGPGAGMMMTPAGKVPTISGVGTRATPSGMEFYVIAGEGVSEEEKAAFDSKAKSLNKTLKPVINKNLKAFAHLNGRDDYGVYWSEVADKISGGAGSEDLGGGDAGDNLTMDDFKVGKALDEALTTGGFVGNGDYSQATTPEEVAASFTGFKEREHEDVLSAFIKKTAGIDINPATTAWCAAFVNAALGATGQKGTGKLNARSFLDWGESVAEPEKGDLVVFKRGSSDWEGHVGFFVGKNEDGNLLVLGGNQDDTVSIKEFTTKNLLGYRRGKL